MSERLEEIKEIYMSDKAGVRGLSFKDISWLIRQAERVKELELEINDWREEVQKWQQFYKKSEESHSETKELLHSTISENKRYKQALEEIIRQHELEDEIDDYDFMWNVKQIARQALKGETK